MPKEISRIYSRIAAQARQEEIWCCPVGGIEPESGMLGRDLDLWVSSHRHGIRLVEIFGEELRRQGYRWVISMHPVWGMRCIGVHGEDFSYVELHLFERLSTGTLDAGRPRVEDDVAGACGFSYSPWLVFFKQVFMKQFSALMKGRPIWGKTTTARDFFLKNTKAIERQLGTYAWLRPRFLAAVLADDDSAEARQRRSGLFGLILFRLVTQPLTSIDLVLRSTGRKLAMYRSPCVPMVEVSGVTDSAALEADLNSTLGQIFPRISIVVRTPGWRQRRVWQARQRLLVYAPADAAAYRPWSDVRFDWIAPADDGERLAGLCQAIMDGVASLNARWSDCRNRA